MSRRLPFSIVRTHGVIVYEDRRMVRVRIPSGVPCYAFAPSYFKQYIVKPECKTQYITFYESTGDNSGMGGTWLPVEAILPRDPVTQKQRYFLKNLVSHEQYPPIAISGNDDVDIARFLPYVMYRSAYPLVMAISAYLGGGVWDTPVGAALRKRYHLPPMPKTRPALPQAKKITTVKQAQTYIGDANLFGRRITEMEAGTRARIQQQFKKEGYAHLLD